MKFTLLGHACWLAETSDVTILFDPLLHDPNQAGCLEVHPRRRLDMGQLPRVDVVVVSHRHIDHFDVASLALLSREAEVLCPKDELVVGTLRKLGFRRVIPLDPWTSIRYGDTRIVTTPSLNNVPELGFVICRKGMSVWNQVDSHVDRACIDRVRQVFGNIEAAIVPWQPLLELDFQQHHGTAFPHRMYSELLEAAVYTGASALIPGACGFRFVDSADWLNRVTFPVTRDRFVRDVQLLAGGLQRVFPADPGDVLCVQEDSAPALLPRSSRFVFSGHGNDEARIFLPVDPFATCVRARFASDTPSHFEATLGALRRHLDGWISRQDPATSRYHEFAVIYQLLVYDNESSVAVWWDFTQASAVAGSGFNSLATATAVIHLDTLRRLLKSDCSWDEAFHSGRYRSFQTTALVARSTYRTPPRGLSFELLREVFPYDAALRAFIAREVARVLD